MSYPLFLGERRKARGERRKAKKKAVSRRLFFHGISLFDFLRYKKDCVGFKNRCKGTAFINVVQ